MSSLVAAESIREFFKGLLGQVLSQHRVEIAESTEFYLVNLLSEFLFADNLFTEEADGRREETPLAMLYARALQQERTERIRTLRKLGDVSLYKAGFFPQALRERSAVGPDYYIQMGGAAYAQVADLAPAGGFAAVYRELCRKFRAVVEVPEEISARGMVANGPQGALKVYETWVRTGSDRLEKVLVDAGMVVPKPGPVH
jgi:hypothetical protein